MDEAAERFLVVVTAGEVVLLGTISLMLAASVFGDGTFLADSSRTLRLAGLVFAVVEMLVPVWILADVWRREDADPVWIHVAAMPLINLVGLAAYLSERNRVR